MHDLTEAHLIDVVRGAPDDNDSDDARLVWADAVGGERGELVVLQIALARGGLAARDAIAYRKRQRELLARHGAAWSGLVGWARRVSFQRGFVDAAEVPLATLVAHAAEIRAQAPLLSALTITGVNDAAAFAALARTPLVRELRGLALVGSSRLELATAGGLDHVRAFGLVHGRVYPGALHPLGRFEHLAVPAVDDRSLVALLRDPALASVRGLDLGRAPADVMALIPPRVRELRLELVDDACLAALAAAPAAAGIERLTLHEARLAAPVDRLGAFPRLRALAIRGMVRAPDGLRLRSLPVLRELALQIPLGEAATWDVAKRLGPQLELLDLTGNPHALRHVHTLKQHVAGELLVAPRVDLDSALLRDGPTAQMAWWDHVVL